MQAMLHGFRYVDMKNESGQEIKGFSCFLGYPSSGVEGEECSKVFVSQEIANATAWSPTVGKPVNVEFTPKGKVSSVAAVPAK